MSLRADRPHASTAINPDLQVRAPERSDRGGTSTGADHFVAQSRLWGALHERLGRSGVSQLLSEGPATAFDLQILHVAGFVESTGIDATTYLPWNAPLAWQGRTQPYYQVLLQSLQAQNQAALGVDTSSSDVSMSGDNLDSLGTWESVGLGWSGALDTGLGLEASGPDAAGLDLGLSGGVDAGAVTAGMDSAGVGGFDVGGAVSREAEGEAPTANQAFTQWFGEKLVASGTGRGLTSEESAFLQEIHGQRFSQVRVHEGPGAKEASQAIAARAFTLGNDIFLGEGGDLMADAESAALLAHEVTHVVQGGQGRLPGSKGEGLSVSSPSQPHEREAEAIGRMAQAVFDTFQQLGPDGEATPGWGLDASWDMDPVGAALAGQLSAVLPAPGLAAEDQVRGLLKSDRSRAGRESVTSQHVLLDVAEALGEDADVVGGLRGVLGQAEASLQGDRSLGELVDLTGAPTAGELGNLSIQDPTPGVVDLASTVTADLTDDTAGPALLGGDGLSGMLFSGGAGAGGDVGADAGADAGGAAVARKASSGDAGVEDGASDPMGRALQTRGQGMSLPQDLQARLEARLGVNLSGVRLHTDARAAESADAVRAEAFTVGQDIYFNAGNFNPYSPEGVELISHEVTHAAQFLQGRDGAASSVEGGVGVTKPGDAVEQEAEAVGAEMAAEHIGSGAGDVAGEADAGLDGGLSVEGAEVSAGDSGEGAAVSGEGAQDGLDTQGTPDAVGADGGDVAARSLFDGLGSMLGGSGGNDGGGFLGAIKQVGGSVASAVPGLSQVTSLVQGGTGLGSGGIQSSLQGALGTVASAVPGLGMAMPLLQSAMSNKGSAPTVKDAGGGLMSTLAASVPGLGAAMPLIQGAMSNKGGLTGGLGDALTGMVSSIPGMQGMAPMLQGVLHGSQTSETDRMGPASMMGMMAQTVPGLGDLVKVVESGLSNIAGPNQGLGRGSLAEGGDTVGWVMQAVPGLPQLVSAFRGGMADQAGNSSGNGGQQQGPAGNSGAEGVGSADRMVGFNMHQVVSQGVHAVGGPTAGAAAEGNSPMGRGVIDVLSTAIPGLSDFVGMISSGASNNTAMTQGMSHRSPDQGNGKGGGEQRIGLADGMTNMALSQIPLIGGLIGDPDKASKFISQSEHDLSGGVDWLVNKAGSGSDWLANQVKDVPVLGTMAQWGSGAFKSYMEFEGGVAKGALGLVSGLASMVANPMGVVKGVASMAEHIPGPAGAMMKLGHGAFDAMTGKKSWGDAVNDALNPAKSLQDDAAFWKGLGGAFLKPYKEAWDQGKYFEVAGRASFEIALLVASGGESAAAKGGSAMGKVAEAGEVLNVAEKGAEIANLAGKGAEATNAVSKTAEVTNAVGKTSEVTNTVGKTGEMAKVDEAANLTSKVEGGAGASTKVDMAAGEANANKKLRIRREDNDFYSPLNDKGNKKAYIDADGNLRPADLEGRLPGKNGQPGREVSELDHVMGITPAKDHSPFTSFYTPEAGAKPYGANAVDLDIERLMEHVEGGKLPGVEVRSPQTLQELIGGKASELHPGLDLEAAGKAADIRSFVKGLPGLSKGKADSLERTIRALQNTVRDQEWLVKGTIPEEFFEFVEKLK